MDRKEARKMDRFTQYAVAASIMAVKDANLTINDENADELVFGLVQVLVEWKHMKNNMKFFRKRISTCKSIFCTNDDS